MRSVVSIHHDWKGIVMECCLSKGELMRLDGRSEGMIIRCTQGSVWLTCGDGADYLIGNGSSYKLPPRGIAVIEAMEPAGFYLSEPAVKGHMQHRSVMALTAYVS